ncbi:hypothetical protein ACOJR9_05565 [Alteromonas sp. A081]|uniref:hypothetical protein n=1 Tax=Alteromonas sp. A081 TaxID=3410269 RepID=UPI003B97F0FB
MSLGGFINQLLAVVVDLNFQDGSSAIAKLVGYNSVSSGEFFQFQIIKVYDKSGNEVPLEESLFSSGAIYHAPEYQGFQALVDWAVRNNQVSITFTDSSYRRGYVKISHCTPEYPCQLPH